MDAIFTEKPNRGARTYRAFRYDRQVANLRRPRKGDFEKMHVKAKGAPPSRRSTRSQVPRPGLSSDYTMVRPLSLCPPDPGHGPELRYKNASASRACGGQRSKGTAVPGFQHGVF